MGVATLTYCSDNGDFFFSPVIDGYYALDNFIGDRPNPAYDISAAFGVQITPDKKPLNKYISMNLQVAHCPEDQAGTGRPYSGLGAFGASGTSYVSSHFPSCNDLSPKMTAGLTDTTRRSSEILLPSLLVAVSEHFASAYVQDINLYSVYPNMTFDPWFHHKTDTFAVLFVDGHCGSILMQTNKTSVPGVYSYDDP
jgi:hypothetical protein